MTGQIIYAGYAIPMGSVVRDFAVYVEGGIIQATGSRAQLTERYPSVKQFGGDHFIMTPGFVNAHDHGRAIGTQSLGIPDSFLEVWLRSLGRLPSLPPYLAAAWEGLQLVKSGVTSVAHSHNPSAWETQFEEIPPTLKGYADAGVRVAMHPVIVDQNALVYADADTFIASLPGHLQKQAKIASQPPPLSADDYFGGLNALYREYHNTETHKVHIQASPAGGQWCSDKLILRAVEWAKANNTRVQMHMLETRYQRLYAFKTWGESFIQHLERIGALGNWLTLAHMVWVDDKDIPLLKEREVAVVHNPSSNLRLRSGIAPLDRLRRVGADVGIGLDGHALDDDQDYLREMRLAWTLANRPGVTGGDLDASRIFLIATAIGAATAFQGAYPIGVLRDEARADLVLLDFSAMAEPIPIDADTDKSFLINLFLRRANKSHVRHVMMGGEWVLRDGQHTRLNEADLAAQIKDALTGQMPDQILDELGAYLRRFYARWDNPPELCR